MNKEWTEEEVKPHIFTEVLVSNNDTLPLDKWVRAKLKGFDTCTPSSYFQASDYFYRYMQPIPKTTTKTIPMGPTTCPSFPWAIRLRDWDEGVYSTVEVVDNSGIVSSGVRRTWEDLYEGGWLDYETGKPLSVEIDVSVKGAKP